MNHQIHNGLNTVLCVAMSEYLDMPVGTWGLLGCYWNEPVVTWDNLGGLSDAVEARLREHSDADSAAELIAAIEHCTAQVPPDRFGIDTDRLRGIAFVDVFEVSGGDKLCRAEAIFDDGCVHQVVWDVAEAEPRCWVHEPAVAARSQQNTPGVRLLSRLLSALQPDEVGGTSWNGSFDRDDHERLNAGLRTRLADAMGQAGNEVLLIRRTEDDWRIETSAELAIRVADLVLGEDLSLHEAIDRLASDPGVWVPDLTGLVGIGTILHTDQVNPRWSSVLAWCDHAAHIIAWSSDTAAPEWQITAAETVTGDVGKTVAAYARLLTALTAGQ